MCWLTLRPRELHLAEMRGILLHTFTPGSQSVLSSHWTPSHTWAKRGEEPAAMTQTFITGLQVSQNTNGKELSGSLFDKSVTIGQGWRGICTLQSSQTSMSLSVYLLGIVFKKTQSCCTTVGKKLPGVDRWNNFNFLVQVCWLRKKEFFSLAIKDKNICLSGNEVPFTLYTDIGTQWKDSDRGVTTSDLVWFSALTHLFILLTLWHPRPHYSG